MVQRIEIEGDLIRTIEVNVIAEANLADALPLIEFRPPFAMFHPRSAIYTQWDESDPQTKRAAFLCELEPGIRTMRKLNRGYRLAFPWTYFLFSFETGGNVNRGENWTMLDHKVYHAPQRVTGLSDRLWAAFLPNVNEGASICFGTTGVPTRQPLPNRVDQLVNEWYLTQFNNDLLGGRSHAYPFNGNNFAPWVRATAEHGLAAFSRFPEWTEGTAVNWSVQEVLSAPTDRPTTVTLTEMIPPIVSPPTFGRAEEWLRSLTPIQRHRILTAGANMVADDPAAVEAPPQPVLDPALEDDGGVPLTEG